MTEIKGKNIDCAPNIKKLLPPQNNLIKKMFSESSIFSKTIFDFLVRYPIISLWDQGASMKLLDTVSQNGSE